jgi:hypothetical protein
MFSKIFQDMTKANNLLSSVAEKGIRLTFIPLSVRAEVQQKVEQSRLDPPAYTKSPVAYEFGQMLGVRGPR